MEEIKRISIVGSGNVASHVGAALKAAGIEILQVYSRNLANANKLAAKLDSRGVNQLNYIEEGADLYLFSLKDDAYDEVLAQWPLKDQNLVHTSGSLEGSILKSKSKHYGVLYPFQSFSIERTIDWKGLPLFMNASSPELLHALLNVGRAIGGKSVQLDYQQRKIYHLAAVFANNFSNRMYHIAQQICENENLDFDLMRPLIKETAEKVMSNLPSEMQTGPAKRVDLDVLNLHYSALSQDPDKQKVYQILSESIIKAQKEHE